MQRLFSFCFTAVLCLAFCIRVQAQVIQTQGIVWSDRKLTWDDFQETGNYKHGADTHWMLLLKVPDTVVKQVPDSVTVGVKALFVPVLSWVNPNSPKSSYLLAHEQLHFDIVELMARHLRREIAETKFTAKDWKRVLEKMKRSTLSKTRRLQRKYDEESEHSRKEAKQLEWKERIENELATLQAFSSTEVQVSICNCN